MQPHWNDAFYKRIKMDLPIYGQMCDTYAFVSGAEGRSSSLEPVELDSVLPTARDRCDISSKRAVLPAGAMTWRWPRQLVTRLGV